MKIVKMTVATFVSVLMIVATFVSVLIGCCPSNSSIPKVPDRFEIVSDQAAHSERHSSFSIMIIKDHKTDKEFKVIYNSNWGVVNEE